MPAATLPSDRSAQLERGSLAVRTFQQAIIQASSKYEADDYRGDKIAFKSICQVPAKRLPATSLGNNYFHHYLSYLESPGDLKIHSNFMQAKLEKTRFLQSAGPWHSTITQVTATTPLLFDLDSIFSTALCNIFSATLKPIDATSFLRGVRARFKVTRYEAFSRGDAGLFRKDIPDSLVIRRVDSPDHVRSFYIKPAQLRATPRNGSVARGPFKAPLEDASTSMPGRVCISWVPGVQQSHVEAWWSDLIGRPCLQQPLQRQDAESLHVRFSDSQFQVQKPMTEGVQVVKWMLSSPGSTLRGVHNGRCRDSLQTALQAEFSDLVADVCQPVTAVDLPAERLEVTDEDLLNSPIPSVKSSEPDFELDD